MRLCEGLLRDFGFGLTLFATASSLEMGAALKVQPCFLQCGAILHGMPMSLLSSMMMLMLALALVWYCKMGAPLG